MNLSSIEKPKIKKTTGEKITAAYQKFSDIYQKKRKEENSLFTIVLIGIILLSALSYIFLAACWPKFSRAEVFFAECVREMLSANDIVTPLYHGTPFFDKPIFSYWLIALSYKTFGISHLTARIPSIILALSTIILTAFAGKKLFGARQATLAAAVLASSVMYMSFAVLCMSDICLVFFDTLSMSLLYLALVKEKQNNIYFYLAALSMGLAFITKGPVGIVLPCISFSIYLTFSKNWSKINFWQHVLPSALILSLAASPWFIAAWRENGSSALSYFFIHENLERFASSTYDTHRPIWFMFSSLMTGMLPWSGFLVLALVQSIKLWKKSFICQESQNKLYLWIWIATVMIFFSLSRGKIDYYALPVYPAAALLIGDWLTKASDEKNPYAKIFIWIASILGTLASIGSFILLTKIFETTHNFQISHINDYFAFPLVLSISSICMFHFAATCQLRKAFKLLFVTVCLASMAFALQIYPWINSKQAVLKFIPYLCTLDSNDRIGVHESLQNWIDEITFQTKHEPMKITSTKMAEQFLKGQAHSILLIQEKDYNKLSSTEKIKYSVLARHDFIPRSLNPIYFTLNANKFSSDTKLLLVSNR